MEEIKNFDRKSTRNLSAGKVTFVFIILLAAFQLQVLSCESRSRNGNDIQQEKNTLNPEGGSQVKRSADIPVLAWEFTNVGIGMYDTPITMVYLVVNGVKHEIQKIEFSFSELTRESFADYYIPKEALTACSGWWAGAGIDYWVTLKEEEGKLIITSREKGETVDDAGEPGDFMGEPVTVKTIDLK